MRHKDIIASVLYLLLILLEATTGLLTNVVASLIPEDLKPYQGWALPLLAITVLCQFVVANLLKRREARSTMQSQPAAIQSLALRGVYDDYRERIDFLKTVHEDYVKGRLLRGLYPNDSGASISPPLVQVRNSIAIPIPSEMSIKEFFDRTGGRLLILGEPGAGKTTLLLELAEALLTDLESKNVDQPIIMPVFLHLQSWTEKRQPFGDWLVKALHETYGLAQNIGRRWVDNDQLCLLLDGLDEVSADQRARCVAAINTYLQDHYIARVVVCSRTVEYDDLVDTLNLQRTVIIRPLTDVQIDAFLATAKEEAVRIAYRKLHADGDNEQRNRFRTPLMLEVLMVTYGEKTREAFKREGVPSTEQDVWKAYVDHMVNEHRVNEYGMDKYKGPKYKRPEPPYNIQQVQRWLGWLASYMHLHQQPEFYVEKLQPDWLSGWAEFSYKGLARVLSALGGGLFTGAAFAFLFGRDGDLNLALAGGLLFWLFSAAIFAIAYGVDRIEPAEGFRLSRRGVGEGMINVFSSVLSSNVGFWLILIMLYGLVTLRFDVLGAFLVFWLIVGLLGGLRGGLAIKPLEDAERAKPNQGIWRSARNGLRAVLLVSLVLGIGGAVWGVSAVGESRLVDGLRSGAALGLFLGLILAPFTGMVGGWQACLLHVVLRLVLWGSGSIPANYVRFLDYASERILLHKVGGRYIFVHRLLLEYFRSLDASSRRPQLAPERP